MSTGNLVGRIAPLAVVAALTWATASARSQNTAPAPPESPNRGAEQTFLTFPEWFLVYSPDEYAQFIASRPPSEFPYLGQVGQFWQGYRAVAAATRNSYPFNGGYHAMIVVIGASTTVEYGIKGIYELCVGRVAETVRGVEPTDEDRFAARIAREYVEFIRVRPWYEFDFTRRLSQLWAKPRPREWSSLRAWERRYALTTEYGAKALYAWLITAATHARYEPAVPVTRVTIDMLPTDAEAMPEMHVVSRSDTSVIVELPRYQAFTEHSRWLAARGSNFRVIAGNQGAIVLSALVPAAWEPSQADRVLFVQPIMTVPSRKRVLIVTTVPGLTATLRALDRPPVTIEHVYDY